MDSTVETEMMPYSTGQRKEEKAFHSLLKWSLILPPVFAAAPFYYSFIGLLGIGIAYFYLAIFVLPFAFSGLGIGYYLKRKSNRHNENNTGRNAMYPMVGYVSGFLLGLEFILVPFSVFIGPLVALAAGGLLLAFGISRRARWFGRTAEISHSGNPLNSLLYHQKRSFGVRRIEIVILISISVAIAVDAAVSSIPAILFPDPGSSTIEYEQPIPDEQYEDGIQDLDYPNTSPLSD